MRTLTFFQTPVVIRQIPFDSAERITVTEYIIERFQKRYDASPPTIPALLFAAFQEDQVIGALAFEECNKQQIVLWESSFDCGDHAMRFIANRESLIEFRRWSASLSLASISLLATVIGHAIYLGKRYGLFVSIESIARYVRALGADINKIEEAQIVLERVPKKDRKYYELHKPKLYMIDLLQSYKPLMERISVYVTAGAVVIPTLYLVHNVHGSDCTHE